MTLLASLGRHGGRLADATRRIQRWRPGAEAAYGIGAVCCAGLAALSAGTVGVPVDSDLGLVAELPVMFWVAVALLNGMFVLAVFGPLRWRPARGWPIAALLVGLVITLFGTAIWITPSPRGEVAWRHIGIADALTTSGVDPGVDAYFNWPGYFALLAEAIHSSGVDPLALAVVAPVVTVLMWLAAAAVVFRALTTDRRQVWLGLWLFCLGNWQDQDYLSPQAFAFFLHLVVLGLALTALAAIPAGEFPRRIASVPAWWRGRSPAEPDRRRRVAALLVCLGLVPAIAASHQLTPFMLVLALVALTVTGRLWTARLPLIAVIVVGLWLAFPASAYLLGHPPLADISLGAAARANVGERMAGTPGHVLVVQLRSLLSVLLWLLALAGAVRAWRRGRFDVRPVALMMVPFVLVPAQTYGGEMLIRASLFALPFTAFLAAGALVPTAPSPQGPGRQGSPGSRSGRSARRGVALVLGLTVLAGLMVTGRYGNARFDIFTADEVAAAQQLPALAPRGALIVGVAHPTPWRNTEYVDHPYRTITGVCPRPDLPPECADAILHRAGTDDSGLLIMFSRSALWSMVLQGSMTAAEFAELERIVGQSPEATLVLENPDARIYRVARS